jgi:nucleoside-diphosphate-sugar epimerase
MNLSEYSNASENGMNGETVALTGGGGFFGVPLSEKLCSLGYAVKILDSFPNGVSHRLENIGKRYPKHMSIHRVDIRSRDSLGEILKDVQYVAHLAAIANPRVCNANLGLAYGVNVEGLRNVLESLPKVKKFLFTSSILIYGDQPATPINEDAKPNCVDNYALLKLMGELLCRTYSNSTGVPYGIIRMAYAYGPWQSRDYVMSALVLQALKQKVIEVWDQRPVRDFVFVDDAVDALARVLLSKSVVRETVNVGSGIGVSTGELASSIAGLLGATTSYAGRETPSPVRYVADVSKIRTLTGWKPTTKFEVGLAKTIDWFKEQPLGQSKT